MDINWSKQEFLAYILFYASQSNFIQSKEEEKYILSKIDENVYNAIHTEIVHDSDYDRVNKIEDYLKYNNVTLEEKQQIIRDLKEVFFADGSVDKYEKNVFHILQKLLY